jgi:hypothetical protein
MLSYRHRHWSLHEGPADYPASGPLNVLFPHVARWEREPDDTSRRALAGLSFREAGWGLPRACAEAATSVPWGLKFGIGCR